MPTQPVYSASGIATYRDSDGITHYVVCYTEAASRLSPAYPWTYWLCDASRSAGELQPGDVDALHPWVTCLSCLWSETNRRAWTP